MTDRARSAEAKLSDRWPARCARWAQLQAHLHALAQVPPARPEPAEQPASRGTRCAPTHPLGFRSAAPSLEAC